MIEINSQEELEKYWSKERDCFYFGESVHFGDSIKTRKSIWCLGTISIEAGGYIEAGGSIEAGGYIEAGGSIFSFLFEINCESLRTKLLPFWRNYWAEMPPMKEWKEQILSDMCWDDLRKLPTKEEAKEICAWEGWHWILRVQLEMFFGLKEKHVMGKETK